MKDEEINVLTEMIEALTGLKFDVKRILAGGGVSNPKYELKKLNENHWQTEIFGLSKSQAKDCLRLISYAALYGKNKAKDK